MIDAQTGEVDGGLAIDAIRPEAVFYDTRAVFDSSGALVAVAYVERFSENAIVGIWNVENHELIELLEGEWGTVWSMAWSHNGRFLAAGTSQGRVLLWDAVTFELIADLGADTEEIVSLAFTHDARLISASRYGSVVTYLIRP